jgi:hypothetical protein
MKNQTTDRLSKAQLISGLDPSSRTHGHFECPVCHGQHLTIFGSNDDLSCKGPEHTAECTEGNITKRIRERLGIGFKPRPEAVDEDNGKASSEAPSGPGLHAVDYAMDKFLPLDWLKDHFGIREGKHPYYKGLDCAVEFPNFDENGNHVSSQWRWGMGKDDRKNEARKPTYLYGGHLLQNLNDRAKAGDGMRTLFIVEGQSNTHTMLLNGLPCVGLPGVLTWKTDWSKLPLFECADTIYFLLDMKEDGTPEPQAVRGCKKVADSFPPGKVRSVQLPCKDVSDLWKQKQFGEQDTFMGDLQKAISKSVAVVSGPEQADLPDGSGGWEIELISADEIDPRAFQWLWEDRIPLNKFNLFIGLPGQGKSQVTIDMISRVTTGKDFPDGRKNNLPPSNVVMLVAEDDLEDTVIPRLIAAGADRSRVKFVFMTRVAKNATKEERNITLGRDLKAVEEKLKEVPDVRLLVIDPVSSYLGDVDANKDKEIRPLLEYLQAFSKRTCITLVGIGHFNKNADQESIHRASGAGAWSQVPRSLWGFVPKPQDEDAVNEEDSGEPQSLMLNAKLTNASSRMKQGLVYEIETAWVETIDGQARTSRIKWLGTAAVTFKEVMDSTKSSHGPKPVKTEAAMRWLKSYLENGPKPSGDKEALEEGTILGDGTRAGHAVDTLWKAKKRLGVSASGNPRAGWTWSLPSAKSDAADCDSVY